ncbi:MAG: tRNA threonylcarbamoyladenosine biosynthesis protein TsaE [Cycloclasticus sp. symbiont of Poecilosclerida sp. M]|nr:MAG: tRNA threonylcarbamoyladenosine biosynthesis protein TsaE [Cycloclasticus sp. symbiont of Poecilosclerida sp. M]
MRIKNEQSMLAFGGRVARTIIASAKKGVVVYLLGDLGAGKTTLVRGFLQSLGHKGAVKSPTYNIVEPYCIDGQQIYHFDLYRLNDAEELEYIGIRDYLNADSICLIEWPEKGRGVLPSADLSIQIDIKGNERTISTSLSL